MKTVWFIRHAESDANAGLVTYTDAEIKLSEKGKEQARALAKTIIQGPDLVVVSPFRRTSLTAQPLLERFHDVPVLTLPLHEFTYLSPAICAGTTANQRKNWVFDYWEHNNPDFVHGEGAESFSQFSDRVRHGLELINKLPYKRIYVFTHGHVMRLIGQQLSGIPFGDAREQMHHFHRQRSLLPVPNCCVFKTIMEKGILKIHEPHFNWPDFL